MTIGEDDVEAAPGPSDADLKRVADLAALRLLRERELAEAEEDVKRKREALRAVEEVDLPAAMLAAGQERCTVAGGYVVELKTDVHASIPVARREEAFAWLDEHGHGAIIKRDIVVGLGREQAELAERIVGWLRQQSNSIKVEEKQGVHAGTLKAFVKEQRAAGAALPDDLFGVFVRRFADVFVPKKRGGAAL